MSFPRCNISVRSGQSIVLCRVQNSQGRLDWGDVFLFRIKSIFMLFFFSKNMWKRLANRMKKVNEKKTSNCSLTTVFLFFLGTICFFYSLYIALRFANQELLDNYSFRQTQTALSAYWLVINGFSFSYETPVAGIPWSIPFEFPIYQYIVAVASGVFKSPISLVGRLVSYFFLVCCLFPIRSITKTLNLNIRSFYIFSSLLFSSPLYLYWGRTFMIETAAVFFAVSAIKYFIDAEKEVKRLSNYFLFAAFISLSILQKATTGLPVLAVLFIVHYFRLLTNSLPVRLLFTAREFSIALICYGLPLSLGVLWTIYTDDVKSLNSFGENLTSAALSHWNWGAAGQRLSIDLYRDVIFRRIFENNLAGGLGIAVLLMSFVFGCARLVKSAIVVSLFLGFVPIFLFTNLHLVHTYYQTGCVVFIIYAVSVALGNIPNAFSRGGLVPLWLTLIMVLSNYMWFSRDYKNVIETVYSKENSRDYSVSKILKREVPPEKYFVAFGNDWSSSFSFLSERKSFTVPTFFDKYEDVSRNPEKFVGESKLGGLVLCPSVDHPSISELSLWSTANRNWKVGVDHGCYIFVPEDLSVNKSADVTPVDCSGNLDYVGKLAPENKRLALVNGWVSVSPSGDVFPEKVYVTLSKKSGGPKYFEALQVNRPDVNKSFGRANELDVGYSRVFDISSLSGKYYVGITIFNKGRLESCQFNREISIFDGEISS